MYFNKNFSEGRLLHRGVINRMLAQVLTTTIGSCADGKGKKFTLPVRAT